MEQLCVKRVLIDTVQYASFNYWSLTAPLAALGTEDCSCYVVWPPVVTPSYARPQHTLGT